MLKENLFIAENQGLDVDEQKKNDILSFIKSCKNFQDFIRKLEEENLIWYFIGPLHKDENIKEQVSSKWKEEFQKFEQSINATHKKFAESLPSENFLVYTTQDNEFKIRFENKEKPIEISTLLRASDEGKVYNLSLGKDSQITATKKGSERHYDFTGSSSCEMTINWQAKDSKGNSIDCSMTVEVNSKGIKRVIDEPKFGEITDPEEVLKLVEQNKEVFINGKTLYQTFTDMVKSVNEQQTPADETFTKDSPQSATPSSSGYSSLNTPSSRRSSLSISSEVSDGAPRCAKVRQEVLGEQLVKIQHKQSLANSLEQTTMLHEVTSVIELVGWTMQGTTKVKGLSSEIPEDIEVDIFMAMEDSMKDSVKASYHSLYRDLRPCHVLKWTSSELGRSYAFLQRYAGTSQQRQELAEDAGEVGLIDSTQNVGKPRTRGSDQQYSNWNRDC
uniref:hypothetical protein n=2 Tax=Wolbachia endosymbiont (group B) of Pilophorus perplexus TaxID=3066160 RepID=UPI00333FA646